MCPARDLESVRADPVKVGFVAPASTVVCVEVDEHDNELDKLEDDREWRESHSHPYFSGSSAADNSLSNVSAAVSILSNVSLAYSANSNANDNTSTLCQLICSQSLMLFFLVRVSGSIIPPSLMIWSMSP